ncbi:MAG TPA: ATP-dependent protease ATPase subunit HslU [Planctomycetaceae bacterium]|nr:ATP-dependent protease ATPase subunit HslU [Planctomycetaceae bacterium]
MPELTPREIVALLDEHIVGQNDAKRAVAVAIRNRWRWQQLPPEIRKEVTPKNIIMIGPTGVGKTEITRRLARLIKAPFIKVEATKYTEVGYHGRDVESMARDLVESAVTLIKGQKRQQVEDQAKERVEERLLDLLAPSLPEPEEDVDEDQKKVEKRQERMRKKFRDMLRAGELEDRQVELNVEQRTVPVQIFSNMGLEQMDVDFQNMFERMLPKQHRERKVTVREARRVLLEQEVESMMDRDAIAEEAVRLAEDTGIIFIDELDKICGPEGGAHGVDVSRQGVQRDLLPVVEGTTIQTRYGPMRTDHVLFIAAGAFHKSKPSDLMPELQGRFPLRVELKDLTRDDFVRILHEPASSITRQYQALLGSDGVELEFTTEGIDAMADIAYQVNQSTQNIGARRLHTIMERLLEDISFEAPAPEHKRVTIDAAFVRRKLQAVTEDEDLSRFIL